MGKRDITNKEASCAIVKADMIRSDLWYFDHMLGLLQNKDELQYGCKLPYRHELRAIMQILLVAFELESHESLEEIRHHYDFEEEDMIWAENLTKEINDHWKRKEVRNLEHIANTEDSLKQKIKEAKEKITGMSLNDILLRVQEDRKKEDPEGRYYTTSLFGLDGKSSAIITRKKIE